MAAETVVLVAIATSLASGLLDEVSKKAAEITVMGFAPLWNLKLQFQRLKRELSKLRALLHAAEAMDPMQQRVSNDLVLLWLTSLKDAAYFADNMLDRISYQKIHRQVLQSRSLVAAAEYFTSDSNPLAFRLMIACKTSKFMSMTAHIYKEAGEIGLRPMELVVNPQRYQLTLPTPMFTDLKERRENADTSFVVGRKLDEDLIVRELCCPTNDHILPVLAIVGISGVGKTTLARKIYDNETVRKHFDKRTWIFVSDNFDLTRLLDEMVQSLKGDNHNLSNTGAMEEKLQGCLEQKKYLLVLDDVWNVDVQIWDSVRTSLLRAFDHCIDSRVLLTTQSYEVASVMGASLTHHVKVLSDDDSWALFNEKAFSSKTQQQQQVLNLKDVAESVLSKCGGLPLAIKTLGCLLGSMNDRSQWELVEKSELWNSILGETKIMPWLLLSFNHLPNAAVKQCFAHCSVMIPKGSFISETALINVWIAQGYIRHSSIETAAQASIKALLDSGLLHVERRHGITYLMMHDLIHDLALYVSKNSFLIVRDINDLQEASRIEHIRICGESPVKSHFKFRKRNKLIKLRTLICTAATISMGFVAQARFLRDLHLVNCELKEVPSSIGRLKHLRSLNLSENHFKYLPESIGKLYMLQVLDLRRCYSLIELPKHVTKLVSLRHIYTSNAVNMPKGIGQLTSLLTLPGGLKLKANEGWKVKELRNLLRLRGQVLFYGLENIRCKEDAMEANLKTKAGVTALGLTWRSDRLQKEEDDDEAVTNDEEVMSGFEPHSNLKMLRLFNFGGTRFSGWLSNQHCLSNLERMSISNCSKCEQLPTLGHLPSLVELELDGMKILHVIGTNFFYTDDTKKKTLFPRLKTLNIFNMPSLKDWVQPLESKSAAVVFPSLEQLEIRNCPLLASVPSCFESLKKLTIQGINSEQPLLMALSNTTNLTSLKIQNIQHLTSINSHTLSKCTSLEALRILSCAQLAQLPPSLQTLADLQILEVRDCDSLTTFPDIEGLLALRILKLCWCKNVTNTPRGLESCTSLETLELVDCPKLDLIPDLTSLSKLQVLATVGFSKQMLIPKCLSDSSSLRILHIGKFNKELDEFSGINLLPKCLKYLTLIGWPKLKSLTSEFQLFFYQLVELCLQRFDGLEVLPEWIGNLSSLEGLWIRDCGNLKYLPSYEAMRRLNRLRELEIRNCRLLEERCSQEKGEEWCKISHLPSLLINGVYLQKTST